MAQEGLFAQFMQHLSEQHEKLLSIEMKRQKFARDATPLAEMMRIKCDADESALVKQLVAEIDEQIAKISQYPVAQHEYELMKGVQEIIQQTEHCLARQHELRQALTFRSKFLDKDTLRENEHFANLLQQKERDFIEMFRYLENAKAVAHGRIPPYTIETPNPLFANVSLKDLDQNYQIIKMLKQELQARIEQCPGYGAVWQLSTELSDNKMRRQALAEELGHAITTDPRSSLSLRF